MINYFSIYFAQTYIPFYKNSFQNIYHFLIFTNFEDVINKNYICCKIFTCTQQMSLHTAAHCWTSQFTQRFDLL